ncbi:MAG: TOMM precursor leader peptide-binding protein [Micropruina sp.]|nr:TOMM precursor leader peptide-binding protein [Micropruina sp.]
MDRDDVADLVRGRDLVLTVVDPGFAAVRAWVNQAGLAAEVPSLQVSLEGADARLGPLVLPGEGPCYLCWRMRALACADDFDLAMAREEALDRARAPLNRPLLPGLVESAAAVLVRDVLALTTSIGQPALAAHVITIDALRGSQTTDTVLTRPDCPACSKKGRPPAEDPCLSELESEPRRETDFDTIAATAAGELCGLVRNLDLIPKVLAEPRQPLIVRAEVANVRFAAGDDAFMTCSGKGMDLLGARNTALGEALERYSSLTWKPPRHRRARRDQLDYPSLDPRELVLFAESQYASLPFAPYSEESELDWVPARSLVSDREVWVPLQGATLGSEHTHGRGLLFGPTSNGFAAGPSLSFAVEHALLEVIERDAFLLAWMHRLETQPYQASTIPDDTTRSIAELYARRGVRIEVHLLPTDSLATVAIAVAWAATEPAGVVGLGAALDPVSAARGAVLEIGQVRPALVARLGDPATRDRLRELVADPSRVAELEDHDLLYADHATAGRGLAHLRVRPVEPWPEGATADIGLRALVGSLAAVAGDALYLDVTTDDVAALGVKVARAIIPGFQPIHFGADQARLGHPRLVSMPATLGWRAASIAVADLNRDPHPLA